MRRAVFLLLLATLPLLLAVPFSHAIGNTMKLPNATYSSPLYVLVIEEDWPPRPYDYVVNVSMCPTPVYVKINTEILPYDAESYRNVSSRVYVAVPLGNETKTNGTRRVWKMFVVYSIYQYTDVPNSTEPWFVEVFSDSVYLNVTDSEDLKLKLAQVVANKTGEKLPVYTYDELPSKNAEIMKLIREGHPKWEAVWRVLGWRFVVVTDTTPITEGITIGLGIVARDFEAVVNYFRELGYELKPVNMTWRELSTKGSIFIIAVKPPQCRYEINLEKWQNATQRFYKVLEKYGRVADGKAWIDFTEDGCLILFLPYIDGKPPDEATAKWAIEKFVEEVGECPPYLFVVFDKPPRIVTETPPLELMVLSLLAYGAVMVLPGLAVGYAVVLAMRRIRKRRRGG